MVINKEFRHSPSDIIYIKDYSLNFSGKGCDDLSIKGDLNFPLNVVIQIDGASKVDTFKISLDRGESFTKTSVEINGRYQAIGNGISILFASITGHKKGDSWTLKGSQSGYPLDWFQTQEISYHMPIVPANLTWEWYVQNQFHKVYDGVSEYEAEFPWADGDRYISKKSVYDAAYDKFINPPVA